MMDSAEFTGLVAAFGADPQRWPPEDRMRALAFVNAHPDIAGDVQAVAARLDAVLELARADAPSAALASRILAAGEARTRFAPSWARLAAVLALSAGLGLGWGGASLGGGAQGDTAYALAFSSFAEPGYDELADFIDEGAR
jgi:hypothetical protein